MQSSDRLTIGADLVVNRLGYGAMQLTGAGVWGEYPDRDAAVALLRHVVDAGVTFIDTADAYGPHTNETLIHDALSPYPADLVIATKGGFIRGGPEPGPTAQSAIVNTFASARTSAPVASESSASTSITCTRRAQRTCPSRSRSRRSPSSGPKV